jgi:hypothetical protein
MITDLTGETRLMYERTPEKDSFPPGHGGVEVRFTVRRLRSDPSVVVS